MSANERPDSAESGAGLPPRHGGYKGTPGYDGPWPPVAPKGPGGGSPGNAESDAGWVTPEARAELTELVDDYLTLMVDDATRQHFNYRMVGDVLGWVAKAFDTCPTTPGAAS